MAAKVDLPTDVTTHANLGRKATLPLKVEKQLLLTMDAKLFSSVRKNFMSLAYQLAIKNNAIHNFSAKNECTGKHWLKSLLGIRNFLIAAQQELHLPGLRDLIKKCGPFLQSEWMTTSSLQAKFSIRTTLT